MPGLIVLGRSLPHNSVRMIETLDDIGRLKIRGGSDDTKTDGLGHGLRQCHTIQFDPCELQITSHRVL